MDKEKIILRVKNLYSTVNLSGQRLDAIADKLVKRNVTEENLDQSINDLNELMPFEDLARFDDWQRSKAQKQPKTDETPKPPVTTPAPDAPNEMPEWFKPFANVITTMQKEKEGQTVVNQVKEKLKDVPEFFWSHAGVPDTADNVDSFVEKVKNNYTLFKQNEVNGKAADGTKPPVSNGKPGDMAQMKDDVKNFIESIRPAK